MHELRFKLTVSLMFLNFICVMTTFPAAVNASANASHQFQRTSLVAVDKDWFFELDTEDGAQFWGTDFGEINAEANQLINQSFYYRLQLIGGEEPLSQLDLVNSLSIGNAVIVNYGDSDSDPFGVTLVYELSATSETEAMVDISVSITNFQLNTLNLHWFAFSNFELDHAYSVDAATFQSSGNIRQISSIGSQIDIEVGVDALPDAWEITDADTLLGKLQDDQPTLLSNQMATYGPGEVGLAFQWSMSIDPLDSVVIPMAMDAEVAKLVYPLPSAHKFPFEDETPSIDQANPRWYLSILSPGKEFMEFRTNSGPNFATVTFPSEIGQGEYSIWAKDSSGNLIEVAEVGGLESFDFTTFNASGVDRFFVLDLELPGPIVLPVGLTMVTGQPVEFSVVQLDDALYFDAFQD